MRETPSESSTLGPQNLWNTDIPTVMSNRKPAGDPDSSPAGPRTFLVSN